MLSGCLGGKIIDPGSSTGSLSATTTTINFGGVPVGQTASTTVSLVNEGSAAVGVSQITVAGQGFSANGGDLPVTVAAGTTYNLSANFTPTALGAVTGQLTITSSSASDGTLTIALSGTGTSASTASLSSLSCASGLITGPGTDNCSVTLNEAADSSGFTVSLASNDSSVSVPATVTVPAGSSSTSFSATVTAVSSTQTATLTASAGGVTESFALQLSAGVSTLSVNTTNIAFGSVNVNSTATQSLTLSSTGTTAVTVSAAAVSGSGFTVSGVTFPLTISAGQTATLSVQFDPTTAGAASGQLALTSNSSTGTSTGIGLSGTGVAVSYTVSLTWDAPSSSTDPVAGYNVYRSPSGSSSYQQLNSSVVTQTAYTDATVQDGETYDYIVESEDASGVTSAPSNTASASIP
ncbi:MAG: choice-of-anchor D domain-containing protein [Terracidiphilus sp.]